MKIIDNLVNTDEIATLKEFWNTKADRVYVNWEAGEDVIDHRLQIWSQVNSDSTVYSGCKYNYYAICHINNPVRWYSHYIF